MSDIDPEELEAYAERTGIPLTAPTADPTPPAEGVVVGESITLDLGSGAAAWDDSELVNAWDAAAEEFKLHNPGPGSWLDKVTAAQAIGKPLPGATHASSKWYTETPPAKPTFVNPYAPAEGTNYTAPPAQRKKSTVITNLKKKRKREEQSRVQGVQPAVDETGSVDMELDSETIKSPIARPHRPSPYHQPQSPAYTPASPPLFAQTAGPALPDRISRTRPSNPYLTSSPPAHAPPAPAASTYAPTTNGMYPEMGATNGGQALTKEEATTRAVNAQWWAGYWFAMSEVMPSLAQLEQTQNQLQR